MRYWNIWNGWKMCILPGCFIQFLFCFVFTVVIYVCILKKSLYSKYTYWHKYVICFKSPGRRMRSKCEILWAMLLLFSRVWHFCNSMNCNSPDFSVHRTSQARILEWVVISSSEASSWPRDQTHVSCIAGGFFTTEPPGKPPIDHLLILINLCDKHVRISYPVNLYFCRYLQFSLKEKNISETCSLLLWFISCNLSAKEISRI